MMLVYIIPVVPYPVRLGRRALATRLGRPPQGLA